MKNLLPVLGIGLLLLTSGTIHGQNWKTLDSLGAKNYFARNYEQAFQYATQAIESYLDQVGIKDTTYIELLASRAQVMLRQEKYGQALKEYEIVLDLTESFLQEEVENYFPYSTYLNDLGSLHLNLGQFEKALSFAHRSIVLTEKLKGPNDFITAKRYNNLGVAYYNLRNLDSTFYYLEKAGEIFKLVQGPESALYAQVIRTIGAIKYNLSQFQEALPYMEKSFAITKKVEEESHPRYIEALEQLGDVYSRLGDYTKANDYFQEMMDKARKFVPKDRPSYARYLSKLADFYSFIDKEDSTLILRKEALLITASTLGKEHHIYGDRLSDLGESYFNLGQYQESEEYLLKAQKVIENSVGKKDITYSTILGDLAQVYKETRKYPLAEQYYLESLSVLEALNADSTSAYANKLHNLADLYIHMRRYDEALKIQMQTLALDEHIFGNESNRYLSNLNSIAVSNYRLGNDLVALEKVEQVIDIYTKKFGKTGAYQTYAHNLGSLHHKLGNYPEAFSYFSDHLKLVQEEVLRNFEVLGDEGKKSFLSSKISQLHQSYSALIDIKEDLPAATTLSYDISLLLKSLLLDSNKSFIRSLKNRKNQRLKETFQKWTENKKALSQQYLKPIEQRLNLDSLETEIKKQEEALAIATQSFNPILTAASFKAVKEGIQKHEATIEFIHFQFFNAKNWTDTTLYFALIQKKDWAYPKMIQLFEERDLKNILQQRIYPTKSYLSEVYDSNLYKLTWEPLEPLLGPIETIYYSPSGLLHRVAFSALPVNKQNTLSDLYNLQFVSTTRNLTPKKESHPIWPTSARIYGGLFYDPDSTGLDQPFQLPDSKLDEEKSIEEEEHRAFKNQELEDKESSQSSIIPRDSLTRGKGWEYLKMTEEELVRIEKKLKNHNIQTTSLKGYNGTEKSFKQMGQDSLSPSILHIATHGFFYPKPEKKEQGSNQNEFYYFKDDDNPMLRSGLVFAEANRAWTGYNLPPDEEDGILTAMEISNVDLSNTKLVVLSACETGLGDIRGSEGVFGLQRAFKMAGVDHLMVTLWKIPDSHHTVNFMETFYSNWLDKKMTIREAFNQTQQLMKQQNTHPYYWAGFLLIE